MASPSPRMPGRRGPRRPDIRVYYTYNRHGEVVEHESQTGSELGEAEAQRYARRFLAVGGFDK